MIVDKIIRGKNIAIRNPEQKVPCSVEGCPNTGRLGYYQVVGITYLGIKAMRVVLFFCHKHQKMYDRC